MGGDVGSVEEVVHVQVDLVIGARAVGEVKSGDKKRPHACLIAF